MLKCEQSYLRILIETNQLVFNVDQTIRIRVLLINYFMKLYNSSVDIYLFESRDFLIKRWISQQPLNGKLDSVQADSKRANLIFNSRFSKS